MSTVHKITITLKRPSPAFPAGKVMFAYYTLVDGLLTLTDAEGRPAGSETGKKYSRKVEPNEVPEGVAAKMAKELRLALRGGAYAPTAGFEKGPIIYPKAKYV